MKKDQIFAIIILFLIILAMFSFGKQEKTPRDVVLSEQKVEISTEEGWRSRVIIDCNHKGRSNEPNYPDSACRFKVEQSTAEVGQSVSLACLKGKCNYKSETSMDELYIQKRLIKKDGDCIWIEGDNKKNSFDSRNFGWLCKGDYYIRGIYLGSAEPYVAGLK